MELLRALGALAFIAGVWLLFLVFEGYGFGISGARRSGWVAPGQKLPGYVELRSPRLARLLVTRYGGYNTKIHTNISPLFNRFYLNRRPNCISHFGIFDWCVTLPLTAWWTWEVTRFFWVAPRLGWEAGSGLPVSGLTLALYRTVMHYITLWNNSSADLGPALTKDELRAALEKEDAP